MRKGFTILELLVASLLLGILMTILTMIFSQSSIAWSTGTSSVADLDQARETIGLTRQTADNAYIWNNQVEHVLGIWDANGDLRPRAVTVNGSAVGGGDGAYAQLGVGTSDAKKAGDASADWSAAGGSGTTSQSKSYTVNVKSSGPNRKPNDYDDIWSFPDDIDF